MRLRRKARDDDLSPLPRPSVARTSLPARGLVVAVLQLWGAGRSIHSAQSGRTRGGARRSAAGARARSQRVGGLVDEDAGMIGRRLPDGTDWSSAIQPGNYWKYSEGVWYAETPNGLTANISAHSIVEHQDGTISVSPSILVNAGRPETWHGFLERGIWRSC